MNGNSYSSRGMASTAPLPRIRKHETDVSNSITAESGRYVSSREHYVNITLRLPFTTRGLQANFVALPSPREMIAETVSEETVIHIGASDGGPGLPIEAHAPPAVTQK